MEPDSTTPLPIIQPDSWTALSAYTNARIALGNVGGSLPLREVLAVKLAHARTQDALVRPLDIAGLTAQLGLFRLPVFVLKSRVPDRNTYLTRPDLGRRLHPDSVVSLQAISQPVDLVFVLADGLSAEAVNQHAVAVLTRVLPGLSARYRCGIALVEQGRVAIGDEIGALLRARFTALFIGERPGLSSPQSMGIYTTFAPQIGLTDERRNCISNIHTEGLPYDQASNALSYLITTSFARQISGVAINMDENLLSIPPPPTGS